MTFAVDFFESKTTWLAVASFAAAVASAIGGHMNPWHAAFAALFAALVAAFRDAHMKGFDEVSALLETIAAGGAKADGGEVPAGPVVVPVAQ